MKKPTKPSCLSIRSALLSFAFVAATAFLPVPALAVCGDVTGDDEVRSSDALAVLREAVGLDAGLVCAPEPVVITNEMGFSNTLFCNGSSVTAQMTWSEHPELTWESVTQTEFPLLSEYFRVDDPIVSGEFEVNYGPCGPVNFDLSALGANYPMPNDGAAFVFPYLDTENGDLYFFLEITPFVDEGAAAIASATPPRFVLARVKAPEGLSNQAD